MKILVAEDEKMCQTAIKNFCKKMDIECDCAENGAEAVEFCKKEPGYAFILMDMWMPELNGVEATTAIRGLGHGSSYKIILMSGDDYTEEEYKKNGFDDYSKKPLGKKVFEEIVGKYK